jgi:hypothetical protein
MPAIPEVAEPQMAQVIQQAVTGVAAAMANGASPVMDLARPPAPGAAPGSASGGAEEGSQGAGGGQAAQGSAATGAAPGQGGASGQSSEHQIEQIAQKVYDYLRRRLRVDMERLGRRGP